jgi:hypothetical protein
LLNSLPANATPDAREASLFWRDRTHEVDFVVDAGSRLNVLIRRNWQP